MLGYPTVDPHGSPFQIRMEIFIKTYQNLANFNKGDKVKFVAVNNSSDDFLKFLNSGNQFRFGF